MPKKEHERYGVSQQAARNKSHELRRKYIQLLNRLGLDWPAVHEIIHQVNIGIHDEALRTVTINQVFEPLEALLRELEKAEKDAQELKALREKKVKQEEYARKLLSEKEEFAEKVHIAFLDLLLKINNIFEKEAEAIRFFEWVHQRAREAVRTGERIHAGLQRQAKEFAERLTAADRILVDSEDLNVETLREMAHPIEEGLEEWWKAFDDYKKAEEAFSGAVEDYKDLHDEVMRLDREEANHRRRLLAWEELFAEAEVDPYFALGAEREEYAQDRSNISELKALINASIGSMPSVTSMSRISNRAETLLGKIYGEMDKKAKKPLPSEIRPKLVSSEAAEDRCDEDMVRSEGRSRSLSKTDLWQVALSIYAAACDQKQSNGRTVRVIFEEIAVSAGQTFGLTLDEFREAVGEAEKRDLLRKKQVRRWWCFKPTAEGYAMAEILVRHLPQDFSQKITDAKRSYNERIIAQRSEYAKKHAEKKRKA